MHITIDNLENASIFTLIFQHIKGFSDFVNLTFQEEKLYIQSMDSSKISVFEVNLKKSFFSNYDFEGSQTIGINVTLLHKILNIRNKKQKIDLQVEDGGDKLHLEFFSEDVSLMNKYLELPLVDLDEEVFGIPEMDYNVSLLLDATRFTDIINDLKQFDDTINIDCVNDKVLISAESSDQGKIKVEMNSNNMKEYSKNEEDIKVSYALKLLSFVTIYNKITDEVKIEITDGTPLRVTYKIENSDSTLHLYLAPKIND